MFWSQHGGNILPAVIEASNLFCHWAISIRPSRHQSRLFAFVNPQLTSDCP
jgi:hypothetical protein